MKTHAELSIKSRIPARKRVRIMRSSVLVAEGIRAFADGSARCAFADGSAAYTTCNSVYDALAGRGSHLRLTALGAAAALARAPIPYKGTIAQAASLAARGWCDYLPAAQIEVAVAALWEGYHKRTSTVAPDMGGAMTGEPTAPPACPVGRRHDRRTHRATRVPCWKTP